MFNFKEFLFENTDEFSLYEDSKCFKKLRKKMSKWEAFKKCFNDNKMIEGEVLQESSFKKRMGF